MADDLHYEPSLFVGRISDHRARNAYFPLPQASEYLGGLPHYAPHKTCTLIVHTNILKLSGKLHICLKALGCMGTLQVKVSGKVRIAS